MVRQKSFAELAFDAPRKVTKRERFLTEMERVIPWSELLALIEPHYPRPKAHGGRPALALETKLRIYCLQQFYSLSDPGAEEALIDSEAMRRFAGIRLAEDPIPDESTLLQFRRLLERHQLTEAIFQAVKEHLVRHGLLLKEGTLVDATLIHAPSSTNNRDRARDPDMTSTKHPRAPSLLLRSIHLEGQSMVFRHEGPHWNRCQRTAAQSQRYHRQGRRLHAVRPVTAR